IYVGRDNHHLVDTLDIHVAQPRLGLIGAAMVEVVRLFLGQRRLRAQVAHVERPLDVVFETRTRQGDKGQETWSAPDTKEMAAGIAVYQVLAGLGIIPVGKLERFQLGRGEKILGALPNHRWLG